mmetsp:Transcript_28822/g.61176  ORF Transcript_28822/g.61176 Transcript_28822/m.61176 type:complete len:94 (+) Transcript_28822:170-451(+)
MFCWASSSPKNMKICICAKTGMSASKRPFWNQWMPRMITQSHHLKPTNRRSLGQEHSQKKMRSDQTQKEVDQSGSRGLTNINERALQQQKSLN